METTIAIEIETRNNLRPKSNNTVGDKKVVTPLPTMIAEDTFKMQDSGENDKLPQKFEAYLQDEEIQSNDMHADEEVETQYPMMYVKGKNYYQYNQNAKRTRYQQPQSDQSFQHKIQNVSHHPTADTINRIPPKENFYPRKYDHPQQQSTKHSASYQQHGQYQHRQDGQSNQHRFQTTPSRYPTHQSQHQQHPYHQHQHQYQQQQHHQQPRNLQPQQQHQQIMQPLQQVLPTPTIGAAGQLYPQLIQYYPMQQGYSIIPTYTQQLAPVYQHQGYPPLMQEQQRSSSGPLPGTIPTRYPDNQYLPPVNTSKGSQQRTITPYDLHNKHLRPLKSSWLKLWDSTQHHRSNNSNMRCTSMIITRSIKKSKTLHPCDSLDQAVMSNYYQHFRASQLYPRSRRHMWTLELHRIQSIYTTLIT